MHIYTDKRTGIKYISYTDPSGRRIRRSLGTRNKSVATIKAADVLDNKKSTDAHPHSIDVFLSKYRAYLKATKSKQTGEIFETAWRKLTKLREIRSLSEINPALLDDLQIAQKNAGVGHAGINRTTRAIRTAMMQAEYWGLIPSQDWKRIVKFRENKNRVEFHSIAEIKQILAICPSADWELVVLLGCRAGLRRGEMDHLKWEDVDFVRGQLHIAANKTENFRFVPIDPVLKSALLSAQKKAKNEFVVNVGLSSSRGSKDYITTYYAHFTRKLPFHCHVHKLRHTFASHLVQAGADLYHVSKLLGHSSIKMTEIYAHLAPRALVDVVALLPKFNN